MRVRLFDSNIEKFILSLEEGAVAKVLRVIDLLERFGNQLGLPHSKKVAQTLFELRVHGKQEVRFFYTFHDKEIILLHGFMKKSPRIPKRELENAWRKLSALDSK